MTDLLKTIMGQCSSMRHRAHTHSSSEVRPDATSDNNDLLIRGAVNDIDSGVSSEENVNEPNHDDRDGQRLEVNNDIEDEDDEHVVTSDGLVVRGVVKKAGCEMFVVDFGNKEKEKGRRWTKKRSTFRTSKSTFRASTRRKSNSTGRNGGTSGGNSNNAIVYQEGLRKKRNKNTTLRVPVPVPDYSQKKEKEGRIHSAVVSAVDPAKRCVTVEWFELGETKGKEVDLDAIMSLNDLIPSKELSKQTKNKGSNMNNIVSSSVSNKGNGSSGVPVKKNRQTMVGVNSSNNNNSNTNNGGASDYDSQSGTDNRPETNIPKAKDRRSNVVKEVEKLKRQREERRAKQAVILEEKEAQRNIDPGNPNWEFLCMIRDYQDQLDFQPLSEHDAVVDHQISVCVRKRPLNAKEKKKREVDVVTCPNKDQVIVHEPKTKVDLTKYLENQFFRFDYTFDENSTNDLVYKYTAKPLVLNIFEGGFSTCFAYGQTGSGKTHTMGGEFHGKQQDSKNGIYALAAMDVFKWITSNKFRHLGLVVSCSYFEIYSGKVFDLLSGKSKLRVLEDGKQQVVIMGLAERDVENVDDVLKLINHGNAIRTSGKTSANAHSSRSHAVFQIILRRQHKRVLHGKFSLIDLAGNERGADTSSSNRQTRMEGAEINKSLLALKECIRALGLKGAHLPFRASKLTQVLRDSFIGEKSKTCMIAMVSPTMSSCEHSLNTLRYADRVKELRADDPATMTTPRHDRTASDRRGEGREDYNDEDDDDEMNEDDETVFNSPIGSDLAQLRSMNQNELSADWFNFQEAISRLEDMEEEILESHRSVIESMQHWLKEDTALFHMTDDVDYDQEVYCHQLERLIDQKIDLLSKLKSKAVTFRETLNDEEAKSRLLSPPNK